MDTSQDVNVFTFDVNILKSSFIATLHICRAKLYFTLHGILKTVLRKTSSLVTSVSVNRY